MQSASFEGLLRVHRIAQDIWELSFSTAALPFRSLCRSADQLFYIQTEEGGLCRAPTTTKVLECFPFASPELIEWALSLPLEGRRNVKTPQDANALLERRLIRACFNQSVDNCIDLHLKIERVARALIVKMAAEKDPQKRGMQMSTFEALYSLMMTFPGTLSDHNDTRERLGLAVTRLVIPEALKFLFDKGWVPKQEPFILALRDTPSLEAARVLKDRNLLRRHLYPDTPCGRHASCQRDSSGMMPMCHAPVGLDLLLRAIKGNIFEIEKFTTFNALICSSPVRLMLTAMIIAGHHSLIPRLLQWAVRLGAPASLSNPDAKGVPLDFWLDLTKEWKFPPPPAWPKDCPPDEEGKDPGWMRWRPQERAPLEYGPLEAAAARDFDTYKMLREIKIQSTRIRGGPRPFVWGKWTFLSAVTASQLEVLHDLRKPKKEFCQSPDVEHVKKEAVWQGNVAVLQFLHRLPQYGHVTGWGGWVTALLTHRGKWDALLWVRTQRRQEQQKKKEKQSQPEKNHKPELPLVLAAPWAKTYESGGDGLAEYEIEVLRHTRKRGNIEGPFPPVPEGKALAVQNAIREASRRDFQFRQAALAERKPVPPCHCPFSIYTPLQHTNASHLQWLFEVGSLDFPPDPPALQQAVGGMIERLYSQTTMSVCKRLNDKREEDREAFWGNVQREVQGVISLSRLAGHWMKATATGGLGVLVDSGTKHGLMIKQVVDKRGEGHEWLVDLLDVLHPLDDPQADGKYKRLREERAKNREDAMH
uniref:Uncharacterized protein n=1 Tax=Chromera velia CCMP2878 TaxID=1169474 RepID=A0A0K6S9F2_9ALVE|eukprot:Cvel_7689.t2-p1 / transcript=Cvel_7689.t2 / gene=Cvel_7689 / organism=Chromera_velia_CCMP2878 / gene_product=hypothetical protein / transcript_product=hypothetical protein / location=Cvel_scaffold408:27826-32121(-) / protein_length=758 / sequence_SO=supercontig / SO=protein_coding / is_pseudo=false